MKKTVFTSILVFVTLLVILLSCRKKDTTTTNNNTSSTTGSTTSQTGPQWHNISNGLPNSTSNALLNLIATSDSNLVGYAFSAGLYHTINKGVSWSQAATGTFTGGRVLALTASGDTIYGGNEIRSVFLSTNKGSTWTQISSTIPGVNYTSGIYALKKVGPYVFVATYAGVYREGLDGSNVISANNGLPVTINNYGNPWLYVTCLENIQNWLYAGTGSGIYKSTDYGVSWTQANNGMPQVIYNANNGQYSNICTKIIYGSFYYLYAATDGAGVFYSSDQGATWNAMNTGLPDLNVSCLTHIGDYYYVVTSQNEIYTCNTMSLTPTWSKVVSDGLPNGTQIITMTASANKLFITDRMGSVYVLE